MRITWQEISSKILSDKNIKLIGAGKGFAEYEANFSEQELCEFLNFQLSRRSENEIKILSADFKTADES